MHAIRKDRRWQNPKFLQKSVEYFDLEQYGTCLSPDVWDPSAVSDEDRLAGMGEKENGWAGFYKVMLQAVVWCVGGGCGDACM